MLFEVGLCYHCPDHLTVVPNMLETRKRPTYQEVLAQSPATGTLHPQVFFEKWIPLIYGVYCGDPFYKACCIDLVIDKGVMNVRWTATDSETAYQKWRWTNREGNPNSFEGKYPLVLEAFLGSLDIILRFLLVSDSVPRYRVPPPQKKRRQESSG